MRSILWGKLDVTSDGEGREWSTSVFGLKMLYLQLALILITAFFFFFNINLSKNDFVGSFVFATVHLLLVSGILFCPALISFLVVQENLVGHYSCILLELME